MTELRPLSALFRRADGGTAVSGSDELRALLQHRLRALCWILAATNIGMALIGFAFSRSMQLRMRESPIAAGSPMQSLLLSAVFILVAWPLAPAQGRSLRALRAIEWILFLVASAELLGLNYYDYSTLGGVYEQSPIDIALGQATYWELVMVMYATLIPNTARRTAVALSVFVSMPLVLDVWMAQSAVLPASILPLVLTVKAVALLAVAATLAFGSYRYERVVRREAEARELGQYRLGARLGSGGMGDVYRGEHRMLRRPVAIKLISPERAGSAEAIARFEREAQATARLTHPNTVQLFDYGRADDGTFYCVMEYLDGETLDALVRRAGPMEPERAVHVLTQLCGALAEAHAQGLVHRDVKPGNVMLGDRGLLRDVAKLLDFGLVISGRPSVDDARLTSDGLLVGTPEYMSPEQCGGEEGAVGPTSDLYSLGAVAYFLLTGASPFAGRAPMQMLAAHLYEDALAPSVASPEVPAALDAVVLRALAKSPALRFASATELGDALRNAVHAP